MPDLLENIGIAPFCLFVLLALLLLIPIEAIYNPVVFLSATLQKIASIHTQQINKTK
jgi:hypothetical protein